MIGASHNRGKTAMNSDTDGERAGEAHRYVTMLCGRFALAVPAAATLAAAAANSNDAAARPNGGDGDRPDGPNIRDDNR
jgi:hypothetical protein